MELTHDLKCKIFGLYWGCECQYLEPVNMQSFAIGQVIGNMDEHHLKIKGEAYGVEIDNAQLLLSPLEAITDDEFVEVFGMKSRFLANSVQWMAANNMLSYQQADRLRELHYALPYGEVRDLFECGIAIDKTKQHA